MTNIDSMFQMQDNLQYLNGKYLVTTVTLPETFFVTLQRTSLFYDVHKTVMLINKYEEESNEERKTKS